MMKTMTQTQMANILKITPAYMSEVLSQKYPISRPLAEKLSELFPSKSFREWRNATPDDIKSSFSQLNDDEAA